MDITKYHAVLTTLLQGLIERTGVALSVQTGIGTSTISRFKDSHLDTAARLIVALELDLVPSGAGRADDDYVRRLESKVARLTLQLEQLQGVDS